MKKTHIVIHHSLTEDGDTVNWGAIRRYHMVERGWTDIGYHFGIERIAGAYEVMLGRMPDQEGAHCKELNMNKRAFGICCVGNFDANGMPMSQINKMARLVEYLMDTYGIPLANVLGHREVGLMSGSDWRLDEYKTCPGKLVDMDELRSVCAG